MGERDAKGAFGLTKRSLTGVPIMVDLPGTYTLSTFCTEKKKCIFSVGRELAKLQPSFMERKD
jgi:hypothetical protein